MVRMFQVVWYVKTLSEQAELKVSGTLGDFNRREAQLYANSPINDTNFANLAIAVRQHDGYVDNRNIRVSSSFVENL